MEPAPLGVTETGTCSQPPPGLGPDNYEGTSITWAPRHQLSRPSGSFEGCPHRHTLLGNWPSHRGRGPEKGEGFPGQASSGCDTPPTLMASLRTNYTTISISSNVHEPFSRY